MRHGCTSCMVNAELSAVHWRGARGRAVFRDEVVSIGRRLKDHLPSVTKSACGRLGGGGGGKHPCSAKLHRARLATNAVGVSERTAQVVGCSACKQEEVWPTTIAYARRLSPDQGVLLAPHWRP